jgi:membrane protein implicated in regulation of membrane protease activity
MSDLLQQFSQYLNLSKLVAVTLPGMVATVALLLFLHPPQCPTNSQALDKHLPDKQTCWYCQGQAKKTDSTPSNPKSAPPDLGKYAVSNLTWQDSERAFQDLEAWADRHRSEISEGVGSRLAICGGVPAYVIAGSRLTSDKPSFKNLGDLKPRDPADLLRVFDACSNALNAFQAELIKQDAAETTLIATLGATFKALSTRLEASKGAANTVLERDLTRQVESEKARLEAETRKDQELTQVQAVVTGLKGDLTALKNTIAGDVGKSVPVEPPAPKTTWQTVAQELANSVMLFLLVSLIVGQILDPIQRGIVSSDPLRGWTFPLLNFVYQGKFPLGAIRYGDRRYPGGHWEVNPSQSDALEANYAIGNGLLTQAEYSSMQDQYYSQSQITTGLIIPLVLLAAVILGRLLCCGIVTLPDNFAWGLFWSTLIELSLFVAFVGSLRWLSTRSPRPPTSETSATKQAANHEASGKKGDSAEKEPSASSEEHTAPGNAQASGRKSIIPETLPDSLIAVMFVVAALCLGIALFFLVGIWHANSKSWWLPTLTVGLPILVFALYLLGVDRLHNFYSEVQARIAGNKQKQAESQIKKFADLLDPRPDGSFLQELADRKNELDRVLKHLTTPGSSKGDQSPPQTPTGPK